MLSITKIFGFEAAHTISSHNGLCKNIHGHSYQLHITITGEISQDNDMLIDFKDLKTMVNKQVIEPLDHALILKVNEQNKAAFDHSTHKIYWLPYEPTAERLVMLIKEKLMQSLPDHLDIVQIKLYETNTSFATWNNNAFMMM